MAKECQGQAVLGLRNSRVGNASGAIILMTLPFLDKCTLRVLFQINAHSFSLYTITISAARQLSALKKMDSPPVAESDSTLGFHCASFLLDSFQSLQIRSRRCKISNQQQVMKHGIEQFLGQREIYHKKLAIKEKIHNFANFGPKFWLPIGHTEKLWEPKFQNDPLPITPPN